MKLALALTGAFLFLLSGSAVASAGSPSVSSEGIYAGRPSVVPGANLGLYASTRAASYKIEVSRIGGPEDVIFAHLVGHNYVSRLTIVGGVAQPNWPVAVALNTSGFHPGVYKLEMRDSLGQSAQNVFVIRTPSPSPGRLLVAFPILTWAAYNPWGGGSFYTSSPRATTVLLARPNDRSANEFARGDEALVAWLSANYSVDWTTDLDLSLAAPSVTPQALVLLRHNEYVGVVFRDWLDQHVVAKGDMGVASFGSNPLYWRVSLTSTTLTIHKDGSVPSEGKWRDPPTSRPEGDLLGAQYMSVVPGYLDYVVQATAPAWLLAGTGLSVGDHLPLLLHGEADGRYGIGVTALAAGYKDASGMQRYASVTFTEHPSGGRTFDAGTFDWGLHLGEVAVDVMTRNVLAWASL